jgi:sugar/nucleoside kinase (ribokinase family)
MWSDGTALTRTTADTVRPVDSTGAGDAFAAGVLAAFARSADVPTSLRAGNELAGRAIVSAGARPPAGSNRSTSTA